MKIQRTKKSTANSTSSSIECATNSIQGAIDSLCKIQNKDKKTKEIIANLGVILLDIKS